MMFGLVGFNQRGSHVQFISSFGAWLCVHQVFDPMQGTLIISRGLNGGNRNNGIDRAIV